MCRFFFDANDRCLLSAAPFFPVIFVGGSEEAGACGFIESGKSFSDSMESETSSTILQLVLILAHTWVLIGDVELAQITKFPTIFSEVGNQVY